MLMVHWFAVVCVINTPIIVISRTTIYTFLIENEKKKRKRENKKNNPFPGHSHSIRLKVANSHLFKQWQRCAVLSVWFTESHFIRSLSNSNNTNDAINWRSSCLNSKKLWLCICFWKMLFEMANGRHKVTW